MIRALVFALALGFGGAALASSLDEARDLVDARRYAEAIARYEVLLAAQPDNDDLLIEAGRVNAWADRHAQAAALYRRALDAAPHRRQDVLLPLAWQLAWGGRHDDAIPLFREAAADLPAQRTEALHGLAESLAATGRLGAALDVYRGLAADRSDLNARKAEARMLLWLDRHDEALDRYRAILADHPGEAEAEIGVARALNYGGRHFAAVSAYAAAVANRPELARDTRVERATALRWAGLDDAAMTTLADAAGHEADTLRSRLAQETASHVAAEAESARDSDDLDITALRLGWQRRGANARVLDAAVRAAAIEQNGRRIDGRSILIGAGTRLGRVDDGLVWPRLTVGARDYDGWQTAAWSLQAKWLPTDTWRIDVEAGNDVVETVRALDNRVTLNAVSASADWAFAPRWRATLGGAAIRFDDGNQRARLIGRLERVVKTAQPRLALGVEAMGFGDSAPEVDRGYYNPRSYREAKAFARAEHEAAGWLLAAKLALGTLRETPGGESGLYAWEASATRDLSPMRRLRIYAGGSDSGNFLQGTGSGYTRHYVGASLIWFY